MLNFSFSEKDLGLDSSSYFVYDFSIKMFLMLYVSTNQISLSDYLYF